MLNLKKLRDVDRQELVRAVGESAAVEMDPRQAWLELLTKGFVGHQDFTPFDLATSLIMAQESPVGNKQWNRDVWLRSLPLPLHKTGCPAWLDLSCACTCWQSKGEPVKPITIKLDKWTEVNFDVPVNEFDDPKPTPADPTELVDWLATRNPSPAADFIGSYTVVSYFAQRRICLSYPD
jgi:hypothetical protein